MRRRRKHITSPESEGRRTGEFTPRNLSKEFLLSSSESESEQCTHYTSSRGKSIKTDSKKSRKTIKFWKMASSSTKVIKLSEEYESISSIVDETSKSSQDVQDARFKTPPRNDSLFNVSR